MVVVTVTLIVLAYLFTGLVAARVAYRKGEIPDDDFGFPVAVLTMIWPIVVAAIGIAWFVKTPGLQERRARKAKQIKAEREAWALEIEKLAREAGLGQVLARAEFTVPEDAPTWRDIVG